MDRSKSKERNSSKKSSTSKSKSKSKSRAQSKSSKKGKGKGKGGRRARERESRRARERVNEWKSERAKERESERVREDEDEDEDEEGERKEDLPASWTEGRRPGLWRGRFGADFRPRHGVGPQSVHDAGRIRRACRSPFMAHIQPKRANEHTWFADRQDRQNVPTGYASGQDWQTDRLPASFLLKQSTIMDRLRQKNTFDAVTELNLSNRLS